MRADDRKYLSEVQYRNPDRLNARSLLHSRYGRGDWFEWLAAHIPFTSGGVVADVGCGAGAFWTHAPPSVPNDLTLRLFDLAPGMVAAAAEAVRGAGRWASVEATVADAAALPLADGCVDTALAIHMLYHLQDPSAGVRELARVVGGHGAAAVVLNPPGNMAEVSALVDEALDRYAAVRDEPLTSEQAIPLLRESFGFIERFRFDDELVVTDPTDLLAYLLSLPIAEQEGATELLASGVARAFAGKEASFRITKTIDLLLCRA